MPVAVDDAILQKFTGQTKVKDPVIAQASYDAWHHRLIPAKKKLNRARRELFYRTIRMIPIRLRTEPWIISLVVSAVAAFSIPTLFFFTFGMDKGLVLALIPIFFVIVGAAVLALFWDRDGESPETRTAIRRSLVASARLHIGALTLQVADLHREADKAQELLKGIRQAIDYPINQLLNARWDEMDGTQFEMFLAEIFTLLGYVVERLGGSGDQGVDPLLTRGTLRIAVQAKCYSSPLGNSPVQEVYAGRVIHGCHRWVVVTNSTFTSGGRAAAAATGTFLIEGSQLTALIRGQIMI